jgi:uncharacterized Tic20 family protein
MRPAGAASAGSASKLAASAGSASKLAIRGSRWVRDHAAQAINVWLTVFLYDLSAVIIGAILMFDSPQVALTVVVTLIAVLWLTALAFLVRAATAAGRGEAYTFPRWLCTRMVR